MAAGAPLGWLVLQTILGYPPGAAAPGQQALYLYMLIGSVVAFGVFGFLLGEREDRLLAINRTLDDLAVTDSLTGLRNARYFHTRFEEEKAESVRSGEPLAFVIIDLDHFKQVNDRYGHAVGDEVLANAARAISSITRHGETVARIGGEEFGLLLPGSTTDAALEVAERVRRAIIETETPLPGPADGKVRMTASAGVVSTAESPGAGTRELYQAADQALYRAKAEGRNRIVVATALGITSGRD